MPNSDWNRQMWGQAYSWPEQGGEWSSGWGGVEAQWHVSLLPRIRHFLPARSILEIAPGHGRWSGFLIEASEKYFGVDISDSCIKACRNRFSDAPHATFIANDGKSLGAIDDHSIDFVFSFDSLVHVEYEIILAYLREISDKLSPDGVGFIHHSNLGEYTGATRVRHILERAQVLSIAKRAIMPAAKRIGLVGSGTELPFSRLHPALAAQGDHCRAESMTARKFVDACRASGLVCIGQEIIPWDARTARLIDCISLVTRPGSRWERPNFISHNHNFIPEAISAQTISKIYMSLPLRIEREVN